MSKPPSKKPKSIRIKLKGRGKTKSKVVGRLRPPGKAPGPKLAQPFEESFEIIIARLEAGETLTKICDPETRGLLPCKATFQDRMLEDEDRRRRYELARTRQFDTWADQSIDIADETQHDYKKVNGKKRFDPEHVQRSKLRIDTRWRMLTTIGGKLYAPKSEATTTLKGTGENGAIKVETDLRVLPPDLAAMLTKLAEMQQLAEAADRKREAELDERERQAEAAGKKIRRD